MSCKAPKCHKTKTGKCVKPNPWNVFQLDNNGKNTTKKDYTDWKLKIFGENSTVDSRRKKLCELNQKIPIPPKLRPKTPKDAKKKYNPVDTDSQKVKLKVNNRKPQREINENAKKVIVKRKKLAKKNYLKAKDDNNAIDAHTSKSIRKELGVLEKGICTIKNTDVSGLIGMKNMRDMRNLTPCGMIDVKFNLGHTNVNSILASTRTAIVMNSISNQKDITVVKMIPTVKYVRFQNKDILVTNIKDVNYAFNVHQEIYKRIGTNRSVIVIPKLLSHRNIDDISVIIGEKVMGATVGDFMESKNVCTIKVATMYGKALRFMHNNMCFHGDAHSNNLMVSRSTGKSKIHPIDFDRAVIFPKNQVVNEQVRFAIMQDIAHALYSLSYRGLNALNAFQVGYSERGDKKNFGEVGLNYEKMSPDDFGYLRKSVFVEYIEKVLKVAIAKFGR